MKEVIIKKAECYPSGILEPPSIFLTWTCPNCKNAIYFTDYKWCPQCGSKIKWSDE